MKNLDITLGELQINTAFEFSNHSPGLRQGMQKYCLPSLCGYTQPWRHTSSLRKSRQAMTCVALE